MEPGSASINNGYGLTGERAIRCLHWLQCLMRLASLLDRCRRSDEQAKWEWEADIPFCNGFKVQEPHVACSLCDEPKHRATVSGPSNETGSAEKSFHPGEAKVPETLNEQLVCQRCIDRPEDPRPAKFACVDCKNPFMCDHCVRWHESFITNHHVSKLEKDEASWFAKISRMRIPEMVCRAHNSKCDHWCLSSDTAQCPGCVTLKCVTSCNLVSSAGKLDLSPEMHKLRSSTAELEKVSDRIEKLETARKLEIQADIEELEKRKELFIKALDSAFTAIRNDLHKSITEDQERLRSFRGCIEKVIDCSRTLTLRQPLSSNAVLIRQTQFAVNYHLEKGQQFLANGDGAIERLGSLPSMENTDEIVKRCLG